MATTRTEWTKTEIAAVKAARRAQPDLSKSELATQLVKARRRLGTRGRPPTEFTGLMGPARVLTGRTVGQLVRAL